MTITAFDRYNATSARIMTGQRDPRQPHFHPGLLPYFYPYFPPALSDITSERGATPRGMARASG